MEKQEIENLRQEIQKLINKNRFCWICGREDLLTDHHVIPKRVKMPLLNIKVFVCENCVKILHINDIIITLFKRIYSIIT